MTEAASQSAGAPHATARSRWACPEPGSAATSSDLPPGGAVSDIVVRAFGKIGVEADVLALPWQRAVSTASDSDDVAAYGPAYHWRHMEGFIAFEPVGFGSLGLVENTNEPIPWSSVDDLDERELRVATVLGYANDDEKGRALRDRFNEGLAGIDVEKTMDARFSDQFRSYPPIGRSGRVRLRVDHPGGCRIRNRCRRKCRFSSSQGCCRRPCSSSPCSS
jgi:hypothetical protein